MFNRKASSHDESLIRDLRKQLKERDERIQSLSSALTDAHETVRDLEDALTAAGATIGVPSLQMWRDNPIVDPDPNSRFISPPGSPPRYIGSTSFQKDMSMLTQSGIQPPVELSATFLDSQQYLFNSNINSDMYDIAAFKDDLQTMQNQLAAKDRQIDELLTEVDTLRTRVRTVNLEYDSFRKTILDMSVCNSDLRAQLAQAQREIEDSKVTIEALIQSDAQRESAYKALLASMDSKEKVTELLASVGHTRASRVSPSTSPQKAETAALQEVIKNHEKEITRLHEVLAEKEAEIVRLVTTCDEAMQMRNEIQILLDQSIQTNQLLKDKIETMTEETRLASVQKYQNTTVNDQIQQIAMDNTSVPYPIYLRSSRNSRDDVVDAAILQLQSRMTNLEPEHESSLNHSLQVSSIQTPDIETLLTSKDEEINLLKKQVQSLEQSLLAVDNQQTASQKVSPVNSRGASPRNALKRGINGWSNSLGRGCYSEAGGANYLKVMKRTRLLIDEASDILSGVGGKCAMGTSMSVVSGTASTKISATDMHLQTIADLREANARIINSIIEKDDQIADMLEIVCISEAELTDIKLLMEEKDRNLAQLSDDLQRKEKELEALVKEVKTAFSEVLELTNTVNSRNALIKDLSDGLTESQELINQLAAENTALVQKMNDKNKELEKLLRESATTSIELMKVRDQGSISKEEQARLLASVKDSISFIMRCTNAVADGNEDIEGNISQVTESGAIEVIASPMHISGKCDVIMGVMNYLTSKTEELKLLSNSYNTKHNRLNQFLDNLASELSSVQSFIAILPEDSQLRSLMSRLSEAIATDLQEARENLDSFN